MSEEFSKKPKVQGQRVYSNGTPLVSIIIPTYNVSADLFTRCFRSLIGQAYENIEIVVVDDGSVSSNRERILEIVATDARAVLIEAPHRGASHARNMGIDAARGEWVSFVDADDEVAPGFVAEALTCAHDDIDLVCGGVAPIFACNNAKDYPHGEWHVWSTVNKDDLLAAANQMLAYRKNRLFAGPDFKGRGPVAKIYRASKLGSLRFNENLTIAEDELFNYKFIRRINGLSIVDRTWYYYYQREGSVLHSVKLPDLKNSISTLLSSVESGEDIAAYHARCAFMVLEGSANLAKIHTPIAGIASMMRDVGSFESFNRSNFRNLKLGAWQRVALLACSCGCCTFAASLVKFKECIKSGTCNEKLL